MLDAEMELSSVSTTGPDGVCHSHHGGHAVERNAMEKLLADHGREWCERLAERMAALCPTIDVPELTTIYEGDPAKLRVIRKNIVELHQTGNGNVSAFNPIVAFCTGSHHNVEFMGSLCQARNAMFYLIPYHAKNKYPITESFSIMHSSLEEAEEKKSQTVKGDEGTVGRKLKQGLARMLNKMQCHMELSQITR